MVMEVLLVVMEVHWPQVFAQFCEWEGIRTVLKDGWHGNGGADFGNGGAPTLGKPNAGAGLRGSVSLLL
jgi:hypothetical protein